MTTLEDYINAQDELHAMAKCNPKNGDRLRAAAQTATIIADYVQGEPTGIIPRQTHCASCQSTWSERGRMPRNDRR